MAFFVLAGKKNCPNLAYAEHVAEHLHNQLSQFRYKIIEQDEDEWEEWLNVMNAKYRWALHVEASPVVWKEVSRMGGKPYLIGNLGEFWEYCYDYYGFESFLSIANKRKILEEYNCIKLKFVKPPHRCHIVSIIGCFDYCKLLDLIVHEMEKALCLKEHEIAVIRIYDYNMFQSDTDFDVQESYLQMIDDLAEVMEKAKIEVSSNLIDAIENCDLLIVCSNYSRQENELAKDWLHRCYSDMYLMAEEINDHAKREMRVILSHPGPVCFSASVLVKNVTKIRLANIIAITSNEGLSTIEHLAENCKVSVQEISCPPVWGFCGISSYVDIGSTFYVGHVYRPFLRATKPIENPRLPKGKLIAELRTMNYMIDDEEDIFSKTKIKKVKMAKLLEQEPLYALIRASASFIKIWQSGEPNDDIVSAGICSNGSFGFTPGIVFSQPLILNEKRFWEPFSAFPVSKLTKLKIQETIIDISDIIEKYKFGSEYD